ncbi:uncharacterized protein PHACADRAFT_253347 [Phanerochaete carnosa HHB-10118-sp]|uniref:Uncharacterized protein n=1 Tax=Phanerochaete carnosa (strain HHB-10118-sp) TaxID=650164 RepID=K5WBG6_PHACS|nr:uncharacterized protein PHACADRAFT_253347 [Phanerochaete carnosa HHB-10118-sp]EKM56294.1 hypothetical protein PHACADRAFT_253347 [Phanerochaete carnosa HHB-10118-sp]
MESADGVLDFLGQNLTSSCVLATALYGPTRALYASLEGAGAIIDAFAIGLFVLDTLGYCATSAAPRPCARLLSCGRRLRGRPLVVIIFKARVFMISAP